MTTTRRRSSTIDAEQQHPLAEAGQEAGQEAGHLAERAAEVGFHQADRAREQTAEGINQLAESVRRVSSDMEPEQPAIANLTSTAAEQAERIAGYLRDTDARQIVHTVEDIARRQPLLFVGGAFVLGIAASRFVKAAGDGTPNSQRTSHGGTSYDGTGGAYEATGPGATRGADRLDDGTDEELRP